MEVEISGHGWRDCLWPLGRPRCKAEEKRLRVNARLLIVLFLIVDNLLAFFTVCYTWALLGTLVRENLLIMITADFDHPRLNPNNKQINCWYSPTEGGSYKRPSKCKK